jgi:hypothetical protein
MGSTLLHESEWTGGERGPKKGERSVSGWNQIKRKRSVGGLMIRLIGHQFGTALNYIAVFTIAWVTGICFERLNTIHPFGAGTLTFISAAEQVFLYFDTAVCAYFSIAFTLRFYEEMLK